MNCENCYAEIEPVLYRGWNAGGMKQVVKKCPACGSNVKKYHPFYSYKDYDFDNLPTLFDERTRHKCEVAGCENAAEEGTMLFGLEKAHLCKTHHMNEWHKKLTPNMGAHRE